MLKDNSSGVGGGGSFVATLTLADHARKIKQAMMDVHTGPTVAGVQIARLAGGWDSLYREQANGDDCTTWVKKVTGRQLDYFIERSESAETVGASWKRINHDVLRYLAKSVPSELRGEATETVLRHQASTGPGVFMLYQNAYVLIQKVLEVHGRKPRARTCARCKYYEGLLRDAGIAVEKV